MDVSSGNPTPLHAFSCCRCTLREVESIAFQATLPDVNNYHHHHQAVSFPDFAWVRRDDLQLKAWSGVGFPDDTSIIIEPFEEKTYIDNS
jgi:hypothetical protein